MNTAFESHPLTCTFAHTLFTVFFYLTGYIMRPAKRSRTETTKTPSTSLTLSITPSTSSTMPSANSNPIYPSVLHLTTRPSIAPVYRRPHPSPPVHPNALHANSLHPNRLPCGHHTHLHASPLHLFTLYHDHPLTH